MTENNEPSERVGDWVTTYMGVKFYPMDPRSDQIHSMDIAHALSQICRFNGHTTKFYSVAEHCCHVHDVIAKWTEMPSKFRLVGLMHDASEAYLGDVPRPLKKHESWPQMYHDAEENIMQVVAVKYGFLWPMDQFTEEVDDALLATEFEQLMPPMEQNINPGKPIDGLVLPCWSPDVAKTQFLKRLSALGKLL